MKIIGLCGGSGSGKGTVANLFLALGIPSVDTDDVYHELTSAKSPCLDALVFEFGEEILANDGSLDRKKLASIVFSGQESETKRSRLNRISHKFVLDKTREILSEYEKKNILAALVDAPLLFESGFDKECDFVIAVIADEKIRIARITERDGISEERARLRINSQLPDEYLIAKSNYTIVNNGDFSELKDNVEKIADQILKS